MSRTTLAYAARLVCAATFVALMTAGCAPTPAVAPSVSPTASEASSPSAAPTPALTPTPMALPTCPDIYSPVVVADLSAQFREPLGDVSGTEGGGGWGTANEAITAVLASIAERVSCTWVLPASESGSTTTIARLDDASRAAAVAAFTAAGYTVASTPDGDLYSIAVDTEVGSYTESHLLSNEFWVASVYSGGVAETLTLDAAALLLP